MSTMSHHDYFIKEYQWSALYYDFGKKQNKKMVSAVISMLNPISQFVYKQQ